MDFVCHEYSSSPHQITTSPEILTPAARHKKRAGGKVVNETRHPLYRGVRRKNGGKWVSEVREPNKKSRIWLGTFPTPETAAVAHDVAALALRGDNAPLNFPEAVARLPRPHSSSHQDIRRAACEAAREFCPVSPSSFRFTHEKIIKDDVISPCHSNSWGQNDDSADRSRAESSVCSGDYWSCNQDPTSEVDESVRFVDEEAVFNMPVLLDSMAEGLLLTPLGMKKGFNWSQYHEVDDQGIDLMNLWGE